MKTNFTYLIFIATCFIATLLDSCSKGTPASIDGINTSSVVTISNVTTESVGKVYATIRFTVLPNSEQNTLKSVSVRYFTSNEGGIEVIKEKGELVSAKSDPNQPDSYVCSLTKLTAGTSYSYVICVKINQEIIYSNILSFKTESWIIPEGAVDLGLSVLWGTCNVGASKPEKFGNKYAWGELQEKAKYTWDNYKWGSEYHLKKYCTDGYYGPADNKHILDLEDDVAHVILGGNWRMPTYSECVELIDNCKWEWDWVGDVKGITITGKNGNTIFLPGAGAKYDGVQANFHGFYWSSYIVYNIPYISRYMRFDSYGFQMGEEYRYHGLSVRPVCD